ncbi:MAG: rhodanese family protein [Pseudomonadota bacterium]
MSLPTIDVARARALLDEGAVMIDVREADEHARERLPGAHSHPLSRLASVEAQPDQVVIFHCRSGARTSANATKLAGAAPCEAYILEGGLEAWKKAGLPVAIDRRQPLEIMRQVQIVAGSLVLLGVVLGVSVAPAFFALSAFVGAGLAFAGITGWCGMAKLLAVLPWNRPAGRSGAVAA